MVRKPDRIAVLAGSSRWPAAVTSALLAAGLAPQRVRERAQYIDRLLALRPALIVVRDETPGWAWWVTAPKIRQETRRIPLIVIAAESRAGEARGAGADRCVITGAIAADLPRVIRQLAPPPDTVRAKLLACQCAEPMPPSGVEGIIRFNTGDYYGQHDLFEALWIAEPEPVRDLYRAILQVGVAYYHIVQGNPRGALKMLRRSAQWLALLPDTCRGVDVRQLRADAAAVEAALRTSSGVSPLDPARLPALRTISPPD